MKSRIIIAAAFAFFAAASASANDNAPKAHSQQEKFTQCSHESKGLKADERHRFMSECLKGHEHEKEAATKQARHEPAHHDQQNRMKSCNEEAGRKNLHGDERRAFMSSCLKG